MLTIYSGYYTTNPIPEWANRAIKKHAHWALHTKNNYVLMTNMDKWTKWYPHTNTWTFGSLIKLLTLEHFINSNNEHYLWMDMDVYPKQQAYNTKIPLKTTIDYYEHTEKTRTSPYPIRKQQWATGNQNWKPHKYGVNTGFYILDKPTAQSLWNFINQEHHINTPQWWNKHLEKQTKLSPQKPWNYGSDEEIIEEWFNKRTPNPLPTKTPATLHSVHDHDNLSFLHYYLETKTNYPND